MFVRSLVLKRYEEKPASRRYYCHVVKTLQQGMLKLSILVHLLKCRFKQPASNVFQRLLISEDLSRSHMFSTQPCQQAIIRGSFFFFCQFKYLNKPVFASSLCYRSYSVSAMFEDRLFMWYKAFLQLPSIGSHPLVILTAPVIGELMSTNQMIRITKVI